MSQSPHRSPTTSAINRSPWITFHPDQRAIVVHAAFVDPASHVAHTLRESFEQLPRATILGHLGITAWQLQKNELARSSHAHLFVARAVATIACCDNHAELMSLTQRAYEAIHPHLPLIPTPQQVFLLGYPFHPIAARG
jgi:hypothetical protein